MAETPWTRIVRFPPSTVSSYFLCATAALDLFPNRSSTTVWVFFALAALDIAANAAAGPAAVATAVHVNGSELTVRALQLGALAGVTKSGVLAFVEFVSYAGIPTPAWLLLILLASSFGICVLVTAEISNLVLGEAPSGLLIAAIVAAIPLGGECMGIYQCHDICPYNVAAAAGAVYGVITGFFHTILGCMAGWTRTESTNGHYTTTNIFGTVSGYDPNWHHNTFL
ncbi:uncharacterized protein N7482_007328 [Penicillium canariense]|uniref:Uncharacterized protein n=1 Tax=Penicillium canariense TaxID=189055 RepID=A0A9W9LK08_9EURO|nr:uncharacterized protein N7482_007328 [Penicillium canariense]KAJ5160324.1 hypothetical protein N7482_007328 [Penicillium canariense]